jgi:hypothetical protein
VKGSLVKSMKGLGPDSQRSDEGRGVEGLTKRLSMACFGLSKVVFGGFSRVGDDGGFEGLWVVKKADKNSRQPCGASAPNDIFF